MIGFVLAKEGYAIHWPSLKAWNFGIGIARHNKWLLIELLFVSFMIDIGE